MPLLNVEEYPVVKVKGRKVKRRDVIYKGKEAMDFLEKIGKEYGMVYVIDVDGYRRNSPNLEMYKRLSANIWIDSLPRNVEDVMDLIIYGFENISIWNMGEEPLKEIKDMCDMKNIHIFIGADERKNAINIVKKYGFHGVITEGEEIKNDVETWKIYTGDWVIRRLR